MRTAAITLTFLICLSWALDEAWSQDTDSISVSVSLQTTITVDVVPGIWNIGPLALGGTAGPHSATATVGNTTTQLEIRGGDALGGWIIGASQSVDQFSVDVASHAITLASSYQVLAATVPFYGSEAFDLRYWAPSGDTFGSTVDQSFDITLKASVAP